MTEIITPADAPENGTPVTRTPGAMLRDAREAGGLSLAAVGEALHLTVHYIKALENDDYSKLPGLIFVKGYIRSYGQYLKMDLDVLLRSYDSQVGSISESVTQSTTSAYERRQHHRRRGDQSLGWALVAGFIVLVALGAGWWFVGRDQDSNQQAAANASPPVQPATAASTPTPTLALNPTATTSNAPAGQLFNSTAAVELASATDTAMMVGGTPDINASVAATIAPPTADVTSIATTITPTGEVIQGAPDQSAPDQGEVLHTTVTDGGLTIIPAADGSRQVSMFRAGNDELLLRFAGDSWVEITDGGNERLYSDMLNAGDSLTVLGTAPFQVLLGNARNVEVHFNDSTVDIAMSVREDNTARVLLTNPAAAVPVAGAGVSQ